MKRRKNAFSQCKSGGGGKGINLGASAEGKISSTFAAKCT